MIGHGRKPMTDKTYTQAEVDIMIAAEREAVLRKARQVVRCLCDQLEAHGYDGFACGGIDFLKNTQSSDQPSALDKALAEAKAEG
jgi:hypothetical protein